MRARTKIFEFSQKKNLESTLAFGCQEAARSLTSIGRKGILCELRQKIPISRPIRDFPTITTSSDIVSCPLITEPHNS